MTDTGIANEAQPAEARPRNRAARGAQRAIAIAGVGVLVMAAVVAFVAWPRTPASGPVGEVPIVWAPWVHSDLLTPTNVTLADMNQAMREKDREKFLAHASGDAQTQLAQWWDNTSAIGWDIGAISAIDFDPDEAGVMEVMLGVQFAFAAHPERGEGDQDAGLQLIQGFSYTMTLDPESADSSSYDAYEADAPPAAATITSIVPTEEPNPWDDGALHVAKRDHVVLFGMSDEAQLVEDNADVAEEAAVIALDQIRAIGGEPTQDGFVSAITADQQRFDRWQYGTGTPWDMDVSGYARPALRPLYPQSWIDPMIATGGDTSGTLVVMGPLSLDEPKHVFVHEFAHALHNTAAPGSFIEPPASVMEGFARYVEWSSGVSEPDYTRAEVQNAIAQHGMGAFSDEALRSEGAWIGYSAAGSYYAYVAAGGGSVWDLAVDGVVGGGLHLAGEQFTEEGWKAWVAAQ